jgi:2'-5' RNA ligase
MRVWEWAADKFTQVVRPGEYADWGQAMEQAGSRLLDLDPHTDSDGEPIVYPEMVAQMLSEGITKPLRVVIDEIGPVLKDGHHRTLAAIQYGLEIPFEVEDDVDIAAWLWGHGHGGSLKQAAWADVNSKAKRIKDSGGVRIISHTTLSTVAEVRGDSGLYQTTITWVPGTKQVAIWSCGCDYAKYAWGRSGRWKYLEGRKCSHATALQYEVQSRGMFGDQVTEDQRSPWEGEKVQPPQDPERPGPWMVASRTALFDAKPHDDLYEPVFEGDDMRPEVRTAITDLVHDAIEPVYPDPGGWTRLWAIGSGASYNWSEAGDLDVQIWVSPPSGKGPREFLGEVRDAIEPLRGTTVADLGLDETEPSMAVQLYAKLGQGTVQDNLDEKPYAAYDIDNAQWAVFPERMDNAWYAERFLRVESEARSLADEIESLLAKVSQMHDAIDFWRGAAEDDEEHLVHLHGAEGVLAVAEDRLVVIQQSLIRDRQKAYRPGGQGIDDPRDSIFKVLEMWGVKERLAEAVEAIGTRLRSAAYHRGVERQASAFTVLYQGRPRGVAGIEGNTLVFDDGSRAPGSDCLNPKYHPSLGLTAALTKDQQAQQIVDGMPADSILGKMLADGLAYIRSKGGFEEEVEHLARLAADANPHANTGAMVALRVPDEIAQALAMDGAEPVSNMHITLAYIGKADEVDQDALIGAVARWSDRWNSLTGQVSGYGLFTEGDDAPVLYASVDIPSLNEARTDLVGELGASGVPARNSHGFTPHLTIAYGVSEVPTSLPAAAVGEFTVAEVWAVHGGDWVPFDLSVPAASWSPSSIPAIPVGGEMVQAMLEDPPSAALPVAYGTEEESDVDAIDREVARAQKAGAMARTASMSTGAKRYSPAEQQDIIDEGAQEHLGASNDDVLDLSGTFYEHVQGIEDDPFLLL